MGGGTFGNRSVGRPSSTSGPTRKPRRSCSAAATRIVMAGLDVTHQFQATPPAHRPRPRAARAARRRCSPTCSCSSPGPICVATTPARSTVRRCTTRWPCWPSPIPHCSSASTATSSIETAGEFTRGMTVIDQRRLVERPAPNCDVLTHVDADAAFEVIIDAITALLALIAHRRWRTVADAGGPPPTVAAMRAAVMTNWELRVDDIEEPTPSDGQVLTKVLACGICGSDLHLVKHGEESRRLSDEIAAGEPARSAGAGTVRTVGQRGDGPRVLLRGGRGRAGREQPVGRRRGRVDAGHVRRRRACTPSGSRTPIRAATPS